MTEEPTTTKPAAPANVSALSYNVSALSYEEAREQLVKVVGQLETGGVSLEQSLALWERGEALADHCEQWLEGARKRLSAARSSTDAQDTSAG